MGLLRKLYSLVADSRAMPGYEDHPRVGKLLSTAQREARLMNHHAIDVEHVILALIANRLPDHVISLPEARQVVAQHLPHSNDPVRHARLPMSAPLLRVVDAAQNMRVARGLKQLPPELLWLAILEQSESPIHKLIEHLRLEEDLIREVVHDRLDEAGAPK